MVPSPHKATIIEHLAESFHMPYIVGCFLISILLGPPGAILVAYITTGFDIEHAVWMTIAYIAGIGTSYWIGVVILILIWMLLFFLFYMTGFMRHQLVSAENGICPILPEGSKTFDVTFEFVYQHWPPLVMTVICIAVYFMTSSDYLIASFSAYAVNIPTTIYLVLDFPLCLVVCCSFAWLYFGSIYGLYKLGKNLIQLRPSTEDRMLGVRPFGNLSLSMSLVYFWAMLILITIAIPTTIGQPVFGLLPFLLLLIAFLAIGIVLFLSPLYAVHKKMVEQKEIERMELCRDAYKGVKEKIEPRKNDAMAEMQRKLDSLTSLMTLEMAEKQLNSVPEWPIDTPIMNKFVTIMVTVIAIIVANLILRLVA